MHKYYLLFISCSPTTRSRTVTLLRLHSDYMFNLRITTRLILNKEKKLRSTLRKHILAT